MGWGKENLMEQQVQLKHGMDDVFGIDNEDNCECYLRLMTTDMGSFAYVSLRIPDPILIYQIDRISFRQVHYFEGALSWIGAKFSTASQEERDKLLDRIDLQSVESGSSAPYLIIGRTPKSKVKILVDGAAYQTNAGELSNDRGEDLLQRIVINPRDGKPSISKVIDIDSEGEEQKIWINVDLILTRFGHGYTPEQILGQMYWLDHDDLGACFLYARQAIEKK
jgi:hypothetical protein